MSTFCSTFRDLLEGALVGTPDPSRLTRLSFHEHLLTCSGCRDLLQAEEVLEMLLASWPRPELPPELSARLVERLREARKLEELLELADPPSVPDGLAGRVLQAVGPERDRMLDARLDEWLDTAGEVQTPVGLSQRVTSALRGPATQGLRARRMFSVRRLAAALLITLGLATAWRLTDDDRAGESLRGLELAMIVPSSELLSALPVLENWEVLFGDEDLDLATGMDFSAEDEALLDFADVDDVAEGWDR
ncbi:MAG: hypothetical protein ACI8QZ_003384 [Chlamydiales bacterium]|jgi:hypothetical protein